MLFLYRLGISCYSLLVWIASFFNQKARKFRTGRQHLFQELSAAFQDNTAPVAWFHSASLGEFEQARPVIEVFKAEYPDYKILITFFSPSGYEVSKNYALADFVCYLPLDTPSNAQKFVACVKPSIAFFVKYEFWYYILQTLHRHNIPTLLISAVFRLSQWLFKPYGAWFRKIIQGYTQIFVQNEFSATCLSQVGIQQYQIAGDTRFDRVIAIVQNKKNLAFAEAFKQDSPTLVLGSSWWKDIQILAEALPLLPEDLKVILVPHEINPPQIASAIQLLNTSVIQYSQIQDTTVLSDYKVLIVDTVGMLTTLYQYADVAYVGGGFEDGQPHNVLEPAVYGVPVFFGNRYQKAKEAVDLVATGGGVPFDNAADLVQKILPLLQTEALRKQKGVIAQQFVFDHAGATKKIMAFVRSILK